ncbi:hypothetical protein Tco_1302968 [Tanacetum coccineum]
MEATTKKEGQGGVLFSSSLQGGSGGACKLILLLGVYAFSESTLTPKWDQNAIKLVPRLLVRKEGTFQDTIPGYQEEFEVQDPVRDVFHRRIDVKRRGRHIVVFQLRDGVPSVDSNYCIGKFVRKGLLFEIRELYYLLPFL